MTKRLFTVTERNDLRSNAKCTFEARPQPYHPYRHDELNSLIPVLWGEFDGMHLTKIDVPNDDQPMLLITLELKASPINKNQNAE
jgi:hypothetical protein